MNKVDKLLKGILEEEMSAEMRTWLMELNLLIDEERALRIRDVMPCDHRYHSRNGRYMLYEDWCEKCGVNCHVV